VAALTDLSASLALIRECDTVEELGDTFARLILPLEMTASASGMLTGPRGLGAQPVHFRRWDPEWLALYDASGFLGIDPPVRYAIVSGESATWHSVYAGFPESDPGHSVLRAARRFNYCEGFVTPVRTRDGSLGMVSIGGPRSRPFSLAETSWMELVSNAVLRRAEAIAGCASPLVSPSVLSIRERECVALIRFGMTDGDIARILRISQTTVRGHVDSARTKLGMRNRTQLATLITP
jgi:DNA-binding CsgD family transcriptional regulator